MQPLSRMHSDLVNLALIGRWLPAGGIPRLLKTDLFDEAVSDGLYPSLLGRATNVLGIDLSPATVRRTRTRYPALAGTAADVRQLPFADASFDVVVSNSTLDHFDSWDDFAPSVRELYRVLVPGGRLLLTLDNVTNPLIRLRNALPFPFLEWLGVVPYYVGPSCGAKRLQRILRDLGFQVLETSAVMHCPRFGVALLARVLPRRRSERITRGLLRFLMRLECLSRWPTRYLTGHFVAVWATKPPAVSTSPRLRSVLPESLVDGVPPGGSTRSP